MTNRIKLIIATLVGVITILVISISQLNHLHGEVVEIKDKRIASLTSYLDESRSVNLDLQDKLNKARQTIQTASVDEWVSLGEFEVTHYGSDCNGCTGTTFTGTVPQLNKTIAVDPNIIPLGSEVLIDGTIYTAEDTGGAIKGNKIDMYVGTEKESYLHGIKYFEVKVRK